MHREYPFFVELTDQIERLVRRMSAGQALRYDGLDLSFAFSRLVFFDCLRDEALYRRYARMRGRPVPPGSDRFAYEAAYLLARDWFGARQADAMAPLSLRVHRWLKPLRLLSGRRWFVPRVAPPGHHDVVFFARSVRFARFFAPMADALKSRCAFLVMDDNEDVKAWLAERGYASLLCRAAGPGLRPMNSLLARFMPGLLLQAEELDAVLRAARPGVVVLPEGNAADDEVINRVARRAGIPVVCMQQGWAPFVHTGFRDMSYAAMLVWGEEFAELLRPFNPDQPFIAAGNYHVPDIAAVPPAKRRGVAFFCPGEGGWLDDEDEAQLVRLAVKLAAFAPDEPIYVRPHPTTPLSAAMMRELSAQPNIQVSDSRQEPLGEVLAKARISVSVYSSTILESAAAGIVPVIFNITSLPRYSPDLDADGTGIEVDAFDAGFDALVRLLTVPGEIERFETGLAQFQRRYFAARGQAAVDGMVAALDEIAARHSA